MRDEDKLKQLILEYGNTPTIGPGRTRKVVLEEILAISRAKPKKAITVKVSAEMQMVLAKYLSTPITDLEAFSVEFDLDEDLATSEHIIELSAKRKLEMAFARQMEDLFNKNGGLIKGVKFSGCKVFYQEFEYQYSDKA
jgi:hypothetical protein